MLNESQGFACPWCGEPNAVDMEPGDAGQTVIQDCVVCCRPIEIVLPDQPDEPIRVSGEGD